MKPLLYSLILATTNLTALPALADDFVLQAPIQDVTVYANGGATITRSGQQHLSAGHHTITIENLPQHITESGIPPVYDLGGKSIKLISVQYKDQPSSSAASPVQEALQTKIDALQSQIQHKKDQISVKKMQLSLLQAMGNQRGGQVSQAGPIDLAEMEKTIAYMGKAATGIFEEIQQDNLVIAGQEKDLASLQRELDRSGKERLDYKKAILTVQSPEAQQLDMKFAYYVQDAGWHMNVSADLNSQTNQMTLKLAATVSQSSGEIWQDVSLALSNAVPSSYIGNIDMYPVFLRLMDPTKMRTMVMSRAGAPADMAMAKEEIIVTGGRIQQQATGYNRLYQLSGKSTITPDNSLEDLTVTDHTVPVNLITRAIPARSPSAYVFADTTLKDFNSLRDVTVALTRDGQYVGEGAWPDLEADKPLELPFGQDPNIEISYLEQAPEDGKTGFISKRSVQEKRYLIKVTNHNTRQSVVEIYDQYPVSAHEDIKVDRLSGATKPDRENIKDQPGIVSWKKALKPGETWIISHAYRIEYPEGSQLSY